MNSTIIKKESICKQLAQLFKGTCQYSPDILCRWDTPIEPDIENLDEFRIKLAHLAKLHFHNKLTVYDVQFVRSFVESVGYPYGHITGSYTTGTWGVRYSQLNDIIKILNLPDFECLPYQSDFTLYDLECKINNYEVSGNYLWVELIPNNPEVRSFKIDFTWNDLMNSDCKIIYK